MAIKHTGATMSEQVPGREKRVEAPRSKMAMLKSIEKSKEFDAVSKWKKNPV